MAVSDVSLRAVAANAVRHLAEADQHYKAGRFPSATASAVLSIEEGGKLSFLVANGSLPKSKRHATHAALFVALLKALGSWGWTAPWAKIIRGEADPADLGLTAQQQQDIAAHPELAEFIRRVQAGEMSDLIERNQALGAAVFAKERREGTFQSWESLFSNGLQTIRLKATYVDVTDSGDIQTDVNTFADESMASFMCTGATGFLIVAILLAEYTRKGLELRDLMANVQSDVTGWNALYGVMRKMFPSVTAKEAELTEAAGKAT